MGDNSGTNITSKTVTFKNGGPPGRRKRAMRTECSDAAQAETKRPQVVDDNKGQVMYFGSEGHQDMQVDKLLFGE